MRPTEPINLVDLIGTALKPPTGMLKTITKHALSVTGYDAAARALDKFTDLLKTVAPRWQCETCHRVIDDDDYLDEPEARYECGECGQTMRENRCESCHKFCAKVSDYACLDESCEGEMGQVDWHAVAAQVAAQAKAEAAQDAAREQQRKKEAAFHRSPAGQRAAKAQAERDAKAEAEALTEREDEILAHAAAITQGRAQGKTTKTMQRELREADIQAQHAARLAAAAEQARAR